MFNKNFIFIGGCPRSGTTLLASLISNHSAVIAIPEAHFRMKLNKELENVKPQEIYERIQYLKKDYSFLSWEIDLPGKRHFMNKPQSLSNFAFVYKILANEFCRKFNPNKLDSYQFIVDHNPDNSKISYSLNKHFPDSGFIHIIRDGRAVANSVIPLHWGPNNIYDAATFWLTNLSFGFQSVLYFQKKGHQLHYENILLNTEQELKKLTEKFKINFEASQLLSSGLILPKFTISQHKFVNSSLNKRNISKWEEELSKRDIFIYEKLTFNMLSLLGYSIKGKNKHYKFLKLIKIYTKSTSVLRNYLNKITFKNNLRND